VVHVIDKTEDAGGMSEILGGKAGAELAVASADHDELKGTFDAIQGTEDVRDRAHAESATEHEKDWEIVAERELFSEVEATEGLAELGGDGDAGGLDGGGGDSSGEEAGAGGTGSNAIEIDVIIDPEGVGFEVGNDTHREGACPFVFEAAHDFDGQIMGTDDGMGIEVTHELYELPVGDLNEPAAESAPAFDERGIVGFLEDHPPKLGRVFDEFDVGLNVKLALKAGDEIQQIHGAHDIGGAILPPGIFEGAGGLEMSTAGGDSGDENAQGTGRDVSGG
jgi:hypothetical protein